MEIRFVEVAVGRIDKEPDGRFVEGPIGRVDKDGRAMEPVKVSIEVCWFSFSLSLCQSMRPIRFEIAHQSGETSNIIGCLHDPLGGAKILLQSVTDDCD